MARVELQHLCKSYDNGFEAVKNLNLSIHDGEFLVLVGPSGCGKTTALRMIAGLEGITSGDLVVDGRRMNDVASRERDMAMVFQSYALYPHMTVAENIGFGLFNIHKYLETYPYIINQVMQVIYHDQFGSFIIGIMYGLQIG